ncbi:MULTISPECIES: TRAP transporter substrate-binding protein [unclassified Paenibacillus]|uniref:TRAP transporter substrate-binding protein n=1 Tax=unclassified Paenibacillus TaxID=185978 RepID=UPI001AE757D8|nr:MULTISPECIES: TRAP transporter substrate-binding protein [unclassified Paenibacillus]MBP1153613.1 tripartite ATP-independent transporter DctP family solute receptor [Paenibacillus sp. PvP091]MBP1171002.1 tripartite ATP-independent transporter DctP family solute receptor [Paenibacillus sp. PvR098]MBP2442030.1 tripartite ATP-independent transporter DctP family solute receptor [Paenibacillus sp. PvP052]
MIKRRLTLGLAAVMALSTILAGCGTSSQATSSQGAGGTAAKAETVELKFGHVLAQDSHFQVMADKMAELASQKSNGSIKITVFPQSQLGGDSKMIQSMRTGVQSLSITNQASLVNTVPELTIFDLPYLFDSIDQANKVLNGPVGQKYLDLLPQHGLVGLGYMSVVERNVFANKAINKPEDMKSLKLRTMQAPGHIKAYELLGSQPTPMAYSEVYLSLQQGVVDGGDTTPDQFIMDKFIEVAKYYNMTKIHYLPLILTMSKIQWDKMSPDQQKIVQEAAKEALAFQTEYYKKEYSDSLEKMKTAGVTVIETDVKALKEQTNKAYDVILKDIPNGKQLLEEIEAAKK